MLALAAAGAFYLGSPHQRLRGVRRPRRLRRAGWLLLVLAWAAAWRALGFWGGGFAMLTAFMLAAVALPYADVWYGAWKSERKARKEIRHVG
ncbi:hypothetical protein L2U69_06400 [Zavarzinia compransoris]|uniref:hypothetical protein n=1 Tax=Zavarzinia marina TaxID=2911065 RepID=UPI001F3B26F7|nr:hypothetical protein [Zavarzinia marina]MCF4165267.1 hypothetical protein [Zavarzinia marina]